MELRILGPFQAFDDSGREVGLPTGRERALLAALVLRRGEVVSVDALVEALWGDTAPSTAVKAVQGYVSHLRRVLGSDGVLVTQAPGYVLRRSARGSRCPPIRDACSRGVAHAAGRSGVGAPDVRAGVGPLARPGPRRVRVRGLRPTRDQAPRGAPSRDRRGAIRGELELGRHGAVVAELEGLVREHPLRERLRGQLMLALYRCGRQADALEVYRYGPAVAGRGARAQAGR